MHKKIILAISLTLLLLPLVVNTSGLESPNRAFAQATEVKLGLLAPKTGSLGALGPGFENAATLAIKELNADANFTDLFTFKLEVEDTKTTPEGSTAAATALADKGVVGFVGAAGSSNTLAAANVAKSKNIVQISYASTSPALTTFKDDDLLWRTTWSDAFQGAALASIAIERDLKTAVTIVVDNSYGHGIGDAFKQNFESSDRSVLASLSYNPDGTPDYTQLVTTIKSLNPDLLLTIAYDKDGNALFNELSVQGYNNDVLGADGVASDTVFGLVGTTDNVDYDSAVAQWLFSNNVTISAPGSETTSATKTAFIANYKSEFGSDPRVFDAETYDAFHAFGNAIKKFNSATADNIKFALPCVTFEGASNTIKFDADGDLTGTPSYALYNITRDSEGNHALNAKSYWVGSDSGYQLPSDCDTRTVSSEIVVSNFAILFVPIALAILPIIRWKLKKK